MILYYALGGGLGHLTRSIAILSALPEEVRSDFMLMASSEHAMLASASVPCTFNVVPNDVMASKSAYYEYLNDCMLQNRIRAIVIDTYPFGLLHEWNELAPNLPRLLIARYLKTAMYDKDKGSATMTQNYPTKVLCIEELDDMYFIKMKRYSDVELIDDPIILEGPEVASASAVELSKKYVFNDKDWLVVNSGGVDELNLLTGFAKDLMSKAGVQNPEPSVLSTEHGIYPANTVISSFANIVSAVGYNMAATALSDADKGTKHHFLPFERRFDDQFLRLDRLRSGLWLHGRANGAGKAAEWLKRSLISLL